MRACVRVRVQGLCGSTAGLAGSFSESITVLSCVCAGPPASRHVNPLPAAYCLPAWCRAACLRSWDLSQATSLAAGWTKQDDACGGLSLTLDTPFTGNGAAGCPNSLLSKRIQFNESDPLGLLPQVVQGLFMYVAVPLECSGYAFPSGFVLFQPGPGTITIRSVTLGWRNIATGNSFTSEWGRGG